MSTSSAMIDTEEKRKLYYDMSIESYQRCLDEARADEKFMDRVQQAARDLEVKGYAVIPGVVEDSLCDYAHAQFWEATTTASNGRLKRPTCADDLKDFRFTRDWYYQMGGILAHGELAHLSFVHALRCHPRTAIVFGALYGVDAGLVVAPDRMNYLLPPEWLPITRGPVPANPGDIARVEEASRIHVDQSLTQKTGLYCIQGLVPLVDADQDGDASLECVEGSHLFHTDMRQRLGLAPDFEGHKLDWHLFTDDQKKKLDSAGVFQNLKSVKARKGSLILWDSRLLHQAGKIRANMGRPRPNPTPRFVVYTCMQPTFQNLTDRQVAQKRKMFRELRCSNHWPVPVSGGKLFGPPRTYGQTPPSFRFDSLVVRPLQQPGVYPILERFYGLIPWGKDGPSLFRAPKSTPLLRFAEASGMRTLSTVVHKKHERVEAPWASEDRSKRARVK